MGARGGISVSAESEGGRRRVDGPWLLCPWCDGPVPLSHLVASDEDPGAQVAVCTGCGRRVSFLPPPEP
ncbi:conserved hypothetical protein [Frankia sp. AiPs1]|uniref:hypothetical protein n=1 Tax=Frankia sp. AiPa1 TaxID=573492 RepID=UPI00202AFE62|nr:hypothetical protein [Frankia sp. AiPa1]MCL9761155.1 hypothetical protein [Frankia sp. AiPa1]